jgi:lysine-specific permease
LSPPYIQIALGGTIGTGLYLTSGTTLHTAGALGALLAYLTSGIAVFFVVSSLGEMATLIPTTGSFNTYAARFCDPALGFTSGWVYWFGWVTTLPIELLACGLFLQYCKLRGLMCRV